MNGALRILRARGIAGVFVDQKTGGRYQVGFNTAAWDAVLEWCRVHGIDPKLVPSGSVITRHEYAITYDRVRVDENGHRSLWQGDLAFDHVTEVHEAGTLPFPPEVEALR